MQIQEIEIKPETSILRLNLKKEEYQLLINMINNMNYKESDFKEEGIFEKYGFCKDTLFKKLQNVKQIDTASKRIATINANQAKTNKSKKAIETAINILRLENKNITVYSVTKQAGISYNTAKKYQDFINSQK